jgi:hypothetical protein
MKRLILLLVLMMAPGLGGESAAFSNQAAAAAGAPEEGLGVGPAYEYDTKNQIKALDEKNHGNEKRLLRADQTNEVEVKRLKLIFLLMMSLGQYRTPVH